MEKVRIRKIIEDIIITQFLKEKHISLNFIEICNYVVYYPEGFKDNDL